MRALPRAARALLAAGACLLLAAAVLVPLTLSGGGSGDGAVTGAGNAAATAQPASGRRWVGSWEAADQLGRTVDLRGRTVRMTMRVTLGGSAVRVRLSNSFGTDPLRIGAATVAYRQADAGAVPGTVRRLRFSGNPSVTVPAGGRLVSDAVPLDVPARATLAVSLYLPSFRGQPTSHGTWGSSHAMTYLAAGDRTGELPAAAFRVIRPAWYFVDGIDVAADDPSAGAVVVLGDSITDGTGSTLDADRRWPDLLYDRIAAEDPRLARRTAVLNAGIAGNRVMSEAGHSVAALDRLDGDVLDRSGVREVVVLLGTNDIGNGLANAGVVEQGLAEVARRARDRGLRVVAATLTPARGTRYGHGTAWAEAQRDEVNRWIRAATRQGTFDGMVDFASVVRDPKRPSRLNPAFNSGDWLHPNDAGYRAMAAAVPLRLLGERDDSGGSARATVGSGTARR
ncbi:hypothetical protein BIV57_14950 [Mangrovactinospora gilvigrisea]|uniref:SGNH hydrolase-type esterase domain-containing protein n=1 Tax=Mangrovactinospora gilvigrisea TaxID=1428644 RepID=A0A1J7BDD5_9ACTN|nr:hypothetical protein BIV57_14950 [Mangrovactinospora gilvigrisea]